MSAKTSPARRAAFMAAVAETGNQTLACERAKVSRSWVTLHRSTDPAFRAELDAAIAAAKVSLERLRANGGRADATASGMRPRRGWRAQRGEELVVRAGNGRRTQIARARLKQWTPRIETRFLEVLAGTANVKAACAAAGLTQVSAYNHRRRWASFERRWNAALATGYARIETAMVEQLGRMLGSAMDPEGLESECEPDLTITSITVETALHAMRLHQRRVHGVGNAPGRRPQMMSMEAMNATILKTIELVERQVAREAAAGDETQGGSRRSRKA